MILAFPGILWDPSECELVIKDIDNKLQVIYAGVSAGRQSFDVYKHGGIVRHGGPYPPTMHTHDEYFYIDKKIEVKSIFTIESDSGMSNFAFSVMGKDLGESDEFGDKYSAIESDITPYKLSFEDNEYYSYEVSDKPGTPDLYTDSEYQKAMDDCFECKFISMDEFNEIKKKRLEAVGAPEEVIDGEELDFTAIYRGK